VAVQRAGHGKIGGKSDAEQAQPCLKSAQQQHRHEDDGGNLRPIAAATFFCGGASPIAAGILIVLYDRGFRDTGLDQI
jgi:hypothetical protein